MDEPAIACSLGAEDYRNRLSAIRKVGEEAFLDMEARPDGAMLSFRDSGQVRAELSSIVEAEPHAAPSSSCPSAPRETD